MTGVIVIRSARSSWRVLRTDVVVIREPREEAVVELKAGVLRGNVRANQGLDGLIVGQSSGSEFMLKVGVVKITMSPIEVM